MKTPRASTLNAVPPLPERVVLRNFPGITLGGKLRRQNQQQEQKQPPELQMLGAKDASYARLTLRLTPGKLSTTGMGNLLSGPIPHAVYGEVSNRTFCHTTNRAGNPGQDVHQKSAANFSRCHLPDVVGGEFGRDPVDPHHQVPHGLA